MKINFISNFQNGIVGEISDAVHLAREMEALGHQVQKVPQDIWKATCEGESNRSWIRHLPVRADINIITKWHHFVDGKYIERLRGSTNASVFYWVWDYMRNEDWHLKMIEASNLYLGNDVYSGNYKDYKNCYYFPFDVADGEIPVFDIGEYKYDVSFFGSCIGQGDRIEWLTEINKTNPIKIFAFNYQDWQSKGFSAEPAVYGKEFNKAVSISKICLGFSVNPNLWGYWSNRVGKTLLAGGFLLQQYAPGMELFLRDGCEYFSSIEEAREKIDYYLIAEKEREKIAQRGYEIAKDKFTSKARIKELMILIDRYLKTNGKNWNC